MSKKKNLHILKLETDVLWYWNNTDRLLCGFLRPKFGVASGLHLASTTGACVVIPEVYAVGTATEAESAYKGVETRGGISYDAAYNKGDYVVAVGAGHGEFFRKPTSPPLPLREGPPSEVFASSKAAVCGMRPHGYESLTDCLLDACCLCWVLARCLLLILAGCWGW